jgi:hypothetical protein
MIYSNTTINSVPDDSKILPEIVVQLENDKKDENEFENYSYIFHHLKEYIRNCKNFMKHNAIEIVILFKHFLLTLDVSFC